jgi:hypothetical protein
MARWADGCILMQECAVNNDFVTGPIYGQIGLIVTNDVVSI